MCGIVGILGKTPVAPLLVDALKRLEYRGYDSRRHRHARRTASSSAAAPRASSRNLEPRLDARAAARHDRHRPHPLGDARRADRDATPIRTSTERRRASSTTASSRTSSELRDELIGRGRTLRDRDRHRGRRPPRRRARSRAGHAPERGGRRGAAAAARRLRARLPVRGRRRPADRRPARARRWPSATARARCISAPTPWRWRRFTERDHLSRGGRLGRARPRRASRSSTATASRSSARSSTVGASRRR